MLTLMVIPSGDLPKEGIELVISAMFKINNVQKELRTIVNVFVS
jgi:hypothetical protein